jgi:hypothetical protein
MRRGIVISIIGLALAFGTFFVFSWPSTLSGTSTGDTIGFPDSPPDQELHVGQMLFTVSGSHEIKIVSVRLNAATPGLSLVAARIGLGGKGASVGTEVGPQPDIDKLAQAAGFTLHPKETGGFVITFRPVVAGAFVFRGITVTYQTGWLTRSVTFGPTVKVKVRAGIAPVPTPTSG